MNKYAFCILMLLSIANALSGSPAKADNSDAVTSPSAYSYKDTIWYSKEMAREKVYFKEQDKRIADLLSRVDKESKEGQVLAAYRQMLKARAARDKGDAIKCIGTLERLSGEQEQEKTTLTLRRYFDIPSEELPLIKAALELPNYVHVKEGFLDGDLAEQNLRGIVSTSGYEGITRIDEDIPKALWRLGNYEMAIEYLTELTADYTLSIRTPSVYVPLLVESYMRYDNSLFRKAVAAQGFVNWTPEEVTANWGPEVVCYEPNFYDLAIDAAVIRLSKDPSKIDISVDRIQWLFGLTPGISHQISIAKQRKTAAKLIAIENATRKGKPGKGSIEQHLDDEHIGSQWDHTEKFIENAKKSNPEEYKRLMERKDNFCRQQDKTTTGTHISK